MTRIAIPFALTIVVFGGLAIWADSGVTRSSPSQTGYVLSTASSPVTGACEPESNEVLSVKLIDGHVVVAVPPYGKLMQRGATVTVRKQLLACGGVGYQVVAWK